MNDDLYKTYRKVIDGLRKKGVDFNTLREKSQDYMGQAATFYEPIGLDEWVALVDETQEYELAGEESKFITPPPFTIVPKDKDDNYDLKKINLKGSSWNSYKKRLVAKQFSQEAIHNVEESSKKILNNLSLDTHDSQAVKGLVIGNVQSGKTANMAGLMSMAADIGWNLIIILSGTIDNLRIQTQNRLVDDLSSASRVSWHPIENLKNTSGGISKISNLLSNENNRLFTVCLKNATRLKDLLAWLSEDQKTRTRLKILLIDDEADQASVNTKKEDRTAINKLIVNLITNKNHLSKENACKFKAINYIAYTATPYANILNEAPSEESLYPANFVACLKNSDEYFGPQVIFGIDGSENDGLNIISTVAPKDIEDIKNAILPKSLKQAIMWFYCCFAVFKLNGITKPVSMMIHTSQRQQDHEALAQSIKIWLKKTPSVKFLEACKDAYEKQTTLLPIEELKKSIPNYPNLDGINDYPDFQRISSIILDEFKNQLETIELDDRKKPTFKSCIYLCIDNCSYANSDNDYQIRLVYPTKPLNFTTGFIVIGGQTLSRGLTIEGLVSTYFLRTVKQADTLMQMGRWFGYRRGYEQLPRIWMTDSTKRQFEFLALLDQELRQEIKTLADLHIEPAKVGIKVKTHPNRQFLNITANNKQRAASLIEYDFGGYDSQTTKFYKDPQKLSSNLDRTSAFIKELGLPVNDSEKYPKMKASCLWQNVEKDKILPYLEKLEFPANDSTSVNTKSFVNWYESKGSEFDNWNVILSSNDSSKSGRAISIGKVKIFPVNRAKKKDDEATNVIRIGALRAPKDLYADIDITNVGLSENDRKQILSNSVDDFRILRSKAGLDKTPLLIVYVIDKDSIPTRQKKNTRVELDSKVDVVGIAMVIPHHKNGGNYMSIVVDEFMNSVDVESDE